VDRIATAQNTEKWRPREDYWKSGKFYKIKIPNEGGR